jgi:hypothetical protein
MFTGYKSVLKMTRDCTHSFCGVKQPQNPTNFSIGECDSIYQSSGAAKYLVLNSDKGNYALTPTPILSIFTYYSEEFCSLLPKNVPVLQNSIKK